MTHTEARREAEPCPAGGPLADDNGVTDAPAGRGVVPP